MTADPRSELTLDACTPVQKLQILHNGIRVTPYIVDEECRAAVIETLDAVLRDLGARPPRIGDARGQ